MKTKHLLGFSEDAYQNALSNHQDKLAAFTRLKAEFEKLCPIINEADIIANPLKALEKQYMANESGAASFGIKFFPLLTMREVSLNDFFAAAEDFKSRKGSLTPPTKEAFEIVAQNEKQVELHKELQAVCDLVNSTCAKYPQYSFIANPAGQGFRGALIADGIGKLKPNSYWIQQNVK
jgi:hypothetical protein